MTKIFLFSFSLFAFVNTGTGQALKPASVPTVFQGDSDGARFGFQAGLNLAKLRLGGLYGINPTTLTTFKVGAVVDLPVGGSGSFSIRPGLFVNSLGFKYVDNTQTEKYNPIYFDICTHALGHFEAGDVELYAGIGPYLAIGFAGKVKYQTGGGVNSTNIQFGKTSQSHFTSTDFGLDFSAGVQLESGISLGLNYGFGLLNIIPSQSYAWQEGSTAQHRVLTFCAGYFF